MEWDTKERFYRHFQVSVATLREKISQLHTIAAVGGERQDAIENVLNGITRLSNEVADAADYVPAYDRRLYSDEIKALKEQLDEATAAFAPKIRFRFKPRAPGAGSTNAGSSASDPRRLNPTTATPASNSTGDGASTTSTGAEAEAKDAVGSLPAIGSSSGSKDYHDEIARPAGAGTEQEGGGIRRPSFSAARTITLSDHTKLHILLPPSASRATAAGALTNLTRCVVDMSVPTIRRNAPFASLTLKDISGCVIVAGQVDGPVHVTGLNDSKVVVTARQVRIHECENVDFYLHVMSRPIIEDCKGVRFTPAPETYLTDKERQETNLYDQVDDFKWLKATPSPNWSLVPEEEIIRDETWSETLSGTANLGVERILKVFGVGKAPQMS